MLSAFAPAVSFAQPEVRDNWRGYTQGGARYGSERLTVTCLPDGNFRYVVTARTLVDLLGQKQESTLSVSSVVTGDLKPVTRSNHETHIDNRIARLDIPTD